MTHYHPEKPHNDTQAPPTTIILTITKPLPHFYFYSIKSYNALKRPTTTFRLAKTTNDHLEKPNNNQQRSNTSIHDDPLPPKNSHNVSKPATITIKSSTTTQNHPMKSQNNLHPSTTTTTKSSKMTIHQRPFTNYKNFTATHKHRLPLPNHPYQSTFNKNKLRITHYHH